MNELLRLTPALLAGMLLGAFFFGGLWWTVRNCVASKWAALCFLGSMLLRTAVVMLGFYLVLGDNWQRLIAGLLGFAMARLLITRITRSAPQTGTLPQKANHAP